MSQHSKRRQQGPSVVSIAVGALATLTTLIVSAWIITGAGRVITWRDLAGFTLGMLLAVMLMAQTMQRLVDRRIAADRPGKYEQRQAEAAERALAERPGQLGTWIGEQEDQRLSVRYDAAENQFYVEGWLGGSYFVPTERPWLDRGDLARTVREMELAGELQPVSDRGTRSVRRWLGLETWQHPALTQRGVARVPSPMPFRDETERELWEREREIPTGVWRSRAAMQAS